MSSSCAARRRRRSPVANSAWRRWPNATRGLDADRPIGTPVQRSHRCSRTDATSSLTLRSAETLRACPSRAGVRSRSPHEPSPVECARSRVPRSSRLNVRQAPLARSPQRHRGTRRQPQRAHRVHIRGPAAATLRIPGGLEQLEGDHLQAGRRRLPNSGPMHRGHAAARWEFRFPVPSRKEVPTSSTSLVDPNAGATGAGLTGEGRAGPTAATLPTRHRQRDYDRPASNEADE